MSEPTPIDDALQELGETGLFLTIGVVFTTLALVASTGALPIWVGAMSVVGSPMFLGYAFLKIGWKRYKQWRYPSYYDSPEADR